MAITALLVAALPLSIVWISRDTNKYRKLVWISVFLTFDLIVFGAFTRLTDSGLGCPDWPGCYGEANPFIAHEQIRAAESLLPTGPVTMVKAWIEMIHRYLAMGIGVLIVAMMGVAWWRWAGRRGSGAPFAPAARGVAAPGFSTFLFFFVCLQGAFGAWTVTQKLQPIFVTGHLVLGMSLLALLAWFGGRLDQLHAPLPRAAGSESARLGRIRLLAALSGLVLLVQLALGAWVSSNYATLACMEFPQCGGAWVPEMDFEHGFHLWRDLGKTAAGHYLPFSALTAIHWVHRNFAAVVLLVLGLTAWQAWRVGGLASHARWLAALLALQALSGVATIYFNFPLAIAVVHNAGAAALVLVLTMINYRAKYLAAPAYQ
ncbi:heme A synthase [Pseudoduganella sp. DS3]|uniref:Heme A synthase n=2 Tax=Pseudoduganella guangdongensis TaxID=2692179 RepID=A0A6N9HK01_9BURK|nr:heme A synthase [Pseudoduganella guangdongensis]